MKKKVILIGTSTGGPSRIKDIISNITNLDATIIIMQHMKEDVLPFFIKDIQDSTHVKIQTTPLLNIFQDNSVIICSKSSIIQKNGYAYDIVHDDIDQHYTPDINKFFTSFAKYSKDFDVCVFILTGIGNDGVKGSILLKNNGAKVIVESELSCAVFGMPRAAIESGIVDSIKSISDIIKDFK